MLAQAFQRAGSIFMPLFICDPSTSSTKDFDSLGISAECLDLTNFRFQRFSALLQIIDRDQIDIIHWNYTSYLSNPYVWALSLVRPRLRHWYTDHISKSALMPPPPTGLRRLIKRVLLRRYEMTICVSGFVERYHRVLGLTDRLVTCLHFINTSRFAPDPTTRTRVRQRENAHDKQILLFVGHLIEDKGIDLAIEAMTRLPQSVVLWIVGTGPETASLEALAQSSGLSDRVRFFGKHAEVQSFMQTADVLLCPSRWAEAAGFVNLEAQACGLPVVGARIGGIPEYVIDGKTGLLVNPDDVEDLALKLQAVLENPARLERLSHAAMTHAAERFSPAAGLPPMLDVYRQTWQTPLPTVAPA